MIRPHAMATLVRDVAVSVSVCHLHTEQKLHGRRPYLASACSPSCSPHAPLMHPLPVICLPSQLCFLSTWAAPILARELSLLPSQAFHGSIRRPMALSMAHFPRFYSRARTRRLALARSRFAACTCRIRITSNRTCSSVISPIVKQRVTIITKMQQRSNGCQARKLGRPRAAATTT